jgi:diguanylate cyclase (GGDEF)-like protein
MKSTAELCEKPVSADPPASPSGGQQLYDAHIMMLDDEPITMEVVRAFLEEAGYRNFTLMDDPRGAVQKILESQPDILLLDLVMPGVSGFEVLEAIRAQPKHRHLPVIILTASSDTGNKLKALDLGATDFLAKPVDPSELKLRVRNTLAAKSYLDQLAYYDPITQLPNRHLFMEKLEWSLNAAKRDGAKLSVMSIELDQFDRISDTVGLLSGDEILREFANRIKNLVRNVDVLGHFDSEDPQNVSLYRLDRGVFSLLLYRIDREESAALVAERVLDAVKRLFVVENTDISMSASVGIASYPLENTDFVELLRLASNAKDYVKSRGGDDFQFSSREINTQYKLRLTMESRLRKALEREELILYYQPKVDVQTGRVMSVEALLRWKDADGRMIPPGHFIPLAEQTGLIVPIGEWALRQACRQWKAWKEAGQEPIDIAVNMSSVQFANPALPEIVERIVVENRMDPRFLILELTESMLLDRVEEKIAMMLRLKGIGLKLSIDDFGTGYSSLGYLKKLPVDELKIDRSFLMDLAEDEKSQALLSSIIYLTRSLGLRTVVEGVESEENLQYLRKQACELYQGFFFSPPIPGNEILKLLGDNHRETRKRQGSMELPG